MLETGAKRGSAVLRETVASRLRRKASRAWKKCRDFALMIPLAAGIALAPGCKPDVCQTHNETSVRVARPTDGKTIDVKELEAESGAVPISEPMLDFVSETHALSTEGLPKDLVLTIVPEHCVPRPDSPLAYAQKDDKLTTSGLETDRGIYFAPYVRVIPFALLQIINHETGHLQPGNREASEAVSTLNPYEQMLMGFVLLDGQGAGEQLIRYAAHIDRWSPAPEVLKTLEAITDGSKTPHDLNPYQKADLFLYQRLLETGGDFGAIRAEIIRLSDKKKVNDALESLAGPIIEKHIHSHPADLHMALRIAYLGELQRRFGPDAAKAYFNATSALLNQDPVFGFEKLSCTEKIFSDLPDNPDLCFNDAECDAIGAHKKAALEPRLCCLEMGPDGALTKHVVEASGMMFINYDHELTLYGFGWRTVRYLWISHRQEIPVDQPCH